MRLCSDGDHEVQLEGKESMLVSDLLEEDGLSAWGNGEPGYLRCENR